MRAGGRISFDDDLVVVFKGKECVYEGIEDYEPMKRENWKFVATTKNGLGHYEFNGYKKYVVGGEMNG